MAKRKKRAATSSRKKRRPVNAAPLQNGRLRNIVLLQNGEQQRSAEQVPNVGRLPSGDRLLLSADHPRNAA